MRLFVLMITISAFGCGKIDHGPLDPIARSFGLGCEMGDPVKIADLCGPQPNDCGASVNGSIDNTLKESQSASIFCTRWCKDRCPSGTFCPNPDHGKEGLLLGFCYRSCEKDTDCAKGSICDFKMGEGACIPDCNTGFTACDSGKGSQCLVNGHCS